MWLALASHSNIAVIFKVSSALRLEEKYIFKTLLLFFRVQHTCSIPDYSAVPMKKDILPSQKSVLIFVRYCFLKIIINTAVEQVVAI